MRAWDQRVKKRKNAHTHRGRGESVKNENENGTKRKRRGIGEYKVESTETASTYSEEGDFSVEETRTADHPPDNRCSLLVLVEEEAEAAEGSLMGCEELRDIFLATGEVSSDTNAR